MAGLAEGPHPPAQTGTWWEPPAGAHGGHVWAPRSVLWARPGKGGKGLEVGTHTSNSQRHLALVTRGGCGCSSRPLGGVSWPDPGRWA